MFLNIHGDNPLTELTQKNQEMNQTHKTKITFFILSYCTITDNSPHHDVVMLYSQYKKAQHHPCDTL